MSNFSTFSERKAAEAAAFLLLRGGGKLDLLKVMKLMYLAERVSFKKYGGSITGDSFVSMRHGPVLSGTYDLTGGYSDARSGGWWKRLVSDRAGYQIEINPDAGISNPDEDLLGLSDADVDCLETVWTNFGHLDKWELVDYTHEHCPEWVDPGNSSRPIPVSRLLKALGFGEAQVHAIDRHIHEQRYLNNALSV